MSCNSTAMFFISYFLNEFQLIWINYMVVTYAYLLINKNAGNCFFAKFGPDVLCCSLQTLLAGVFIHQMILQIM